MKYFIHLPMKMEPIVSSETSAIRTQTPGNYPKRNKLHLEHGESLKTFPFLPQYDSSSLRNFPTNSEAHYHAFVISNSRSGHPTHVVSFGCPSRESKHLAN